MNWIPQSWRYWIAAGILRDLEERHGREVVVNRAQAFEAGHQHGFLKGRALGQLEGQQTLLAQMGQYLDERHADTPEVTPADIERAKKGLVH